ncbi:hypothetical protein CHARACLAT_005119 [Characodon lateralis]|uniref:Uncharacterized protein n=1 Tax=Characodon lateralis TaxID=208331 RepID=A0ABU7CYP4_9TELE|nr:hypothetical protein [Characodon lateralis]
MYSSAFEHVFECYYRAISCLDRRFKQELQFRPLKMKRLYLVEPVVALYAFSSFLIYPLVQQYVYRRLWQQLTNTTYPVSDNTSRCAPSNSSSNHTNFHKVSSELQDVRMHSSPGVFQIILFGTNFSLVSHRPNKAKEKG